MKKFLFFSILFSLTASLQDMEAAVRVQTDAKGMITNVYGGERRAYNRGSDGSYRYFSQIYQQSGAVYVVVDGDNWYIKDVLTYPKVDGWVKGTLSADGTTLTIAPNQLIKSTVTSDPAIDWTLNMGQTTDEGKHWTKIPDMITYSVDGNYLWLNDADLFEDALGNTTYDKILGAFFAEDDNFANYGEWGTSLELIEDYIAPDTKLVTVPAGATVEEWHLNCKSGSDNINEAINVAFDGSDIYLQGLLRHFPDAWIKGTIDGSTVIFKRMQYLGQYNGLDHWAVSAKSDGVGITDFKMNYNEAEKILTNLNTIYENMSDVAINYTARYSNIKIMAELPADQLNGVEPPYYNNISTKTNLSAFTVIDANNDYETWKYVTSKRTVRYEGSYDQDADDWMVTPAIQIYAGRTYQLSIDVHAESYDYMAGTHRIEVMYGTGNDAASLTETVIPEFIFDRNDYSTHTLIGTFSVPASADMYFGIHAISDAANYYLYANNLRIEEVPFHMNNSGMATYSAAADIKIKTPGITAYKASISGETITLTALDGYIPAGTGVLLYGEGLEGAAFSVASPSSTDQPADMSGNILLPTTLADGSLAIRSSSNVYALSSDNTFLRYTGSQFVHNRAYIEYSGSASRLSVSFDETDGISLINDEMLQNALSFDLQGRQIQGQSKGLQIKNNKIIMVK